MSFRFAPVVASAFLVIGGGARLARAGQPQPAPANAAVQSPSLIRGEGLDVTVRARPLDRPLSLDGRLDETTYEIFPAISGFMQQEPRELVPSTELTEVWVLFDETSLYVSGRCWDSQPERMVINEMRRDGRNFTNNEHIVVVLDTFHDRRNGFYFSTNPLGAMRDQAIIGEVQNDDWNTVWDAKSSRFDQGWTFEMKIPFKYAGSGPQVWGINFRRVIKWKNEWTYLMPIKASDGIGAVNKVSLAGTLVGLETPAQSMNLELKPYTVSSVTTDRAAAVPFENDGSADVGFDFKYGLTRGLIFDATVNTDFAQVEEDVQQVNLTRFSLFFPEKRDFFLEGQGIFAFGGVQFGNADAIPGEVPVLFFSRRIGLNEGQSVPVVAGGRLTGKAGRFTIGMLNIETGDKPEANAVATNFTVARVKFDVLRRSIIGVLATHRAPTLGGGGHNYTLGADTNLILTNVFAVNAYYARTKSPGDHADEVSYRGKFDYTGDRYGLAGEHLTVGEGFNPEVGFVRRSDFRRNFLQGRFSPRPKRDRVVRKLNWIGSMDYITDFHLTSLEYREAKGMFRVDFQNSDNVSVEYSTEYELLPEEFTIATDVAVPAGGYGFDTTRVSYSMGQQRRISGRLSAATGSFYDGTKTEASYSGRLAVASRFSMEPSVSVNWVELPYGEFTATVLSTRFIVTPSPRMLLSSLVQFNSGSHSLNSSVRLRWEYTPGSELFVVYSDGRETDVRGVPNVLNRSFAVKVTRLLRF